MCTLFVTGQSLGALALGECGQEETPRAVKTFLDHVPYKRNGLLMGNGGKERGDLWPSS